MTTRRCRPFKRHRLMKTTTIASRFYSNTTRDETQYIYIYISSDPIWLDRPPRPTTLLPGRTRRPGLIPIITGPRSRFDAGISVLDDLGRVRGRPSTGLCVVTGDTTIAAAAVVAPTYRVPRGRASGTGGCRMGRITDGATFPAANGRASEHTRKRTKRDRDGKTRVA